MATFHIPLFFTLTSFTKEPLFYISQCFFDALKVVFIYIHSSFLHIYGWFPLGFCEVAIGLLSIQNCRSGGLGAVLIML